jgi:uncharacterized membrane protein YtjA (UPF0391 family)
VGVLGFGGVPAGATSVQSGSYLELG